MATEIENKVVKMTFDNKSFEKGVDDTLKTIDKLNDALKFKGASEGFNEIQDAADATDLTKVQKGVENLSDKFSGLGIIGMTIWSHIGDAIWNFATGPLNKAIGLIDGSIDKITGQIKSGGWNRALNLEQAGFMLNNLGYGWDSVNKGEKAVNKEGKEVINTYKTVQTAVDGTAYSLDQAAAASANFLAAGVKEGDELYDTLRSVMGIASTFSADFDQVSSYMQKIAANGSMTAGMSTYMTQVLKMPVDQILMKNLHLSAEELSKAYKQGLISFNTVRDIFLKEFGDSLDKANDTYKGALANFNSALSRIGAKVAEEILPSIIEALNAGRLFANAVNEEFSKSGLVDTLNDIAKFFLGFASSMVSLDKDGKRYLNDNAKPLLQMANEIMGIISDLLKVWLLLHKAIFEGFASVKKDGKDNISILGGIRDITAAILSVVQKEYESGRLTAFFSIIAKVLSVIFTILKVGFKVVTTVLAGVIKIVGHLSSVIGVVFKFFDKLSSAISESPRFQAAVEKIDGAFEILYNVIEDVIDAISDCIGYIFDFIEKNDLIEIAAEGVATALEAMFSALEFVWGFLKDVAKGVYDEFNNLKDSGFFDDVAENFKLFYESIREQIQETIQKFEEFTGIDIHIPKSFEEFKQAMLDGFDAIKQRAEELAGFIGMIFTDPKQAFGYAKESLEDIGEYVSTGFSDAFEGAKETTEKAATNIKEFAGGFKEATDNMEDFNEEADKLDGKEDKFSFFGVLAEVFTTVGEAFGFLAKAIKDLGSAIWDIMKSSFEAFKELTGGEITWDKFLDTIHKGFKIFATYEWGKAGKKFGDFADAISNGVAKLLHGSSTPKLSAVALIIKRAGRFLLAVAAAVLSMALAATMIKDAGIELSDVEKALRLFAEILAGFLAAYVLIQLVFKKFPLPKRAAKPVKTLKEIKERLESTGKFMQAVNWGGLAKMILGIGASILLIAIALKIIIDSVARDDVSEAQMAVAISTLFRIIFALFNFFALFVVAAALCKKFKVTKAQITNINTLIYTFSSFVKALATAVIMIAAAIAVLTLVAKFAGDGDNNAFDRAVGAVVGIMSCMTIIALLLIGASKLFSTDGKSLEFLGSMGTMFLMMAAAIDLITPAMIALGSVKPETFQQGLVGIGIIFILLALMGFVADKIKPENAKTGATLMLTVAGVLLIAAASCALIGAVGCEAIGSALTLSVLMFVIMIVVAAVGAFAKDAENSAILMASIAATILVAALGVVALASVDTGKMWSAVGAITAILAVILILSLILGAKGSPVGAGMEKLGVSALMLGAGLFLVAAALTLMSNLLKTGADDTKSFIIGLRDVLTQCREPISQLIEMLVIVIVSLVLGVLEGLAKSINDLLMKLGDVLVNAAKGLGWVAYGLADCIIEIIVGVLMALSDRAGEIGYAVGVFLEACLFAIATAIATFISKIIERFKALLGIHSPSSVFDNIGVNMIMGLLQGLGSMLSKIIDWFVSLGGDILEAIAGIPLKLFSVGASFAQSILEGLGSIGTGILDWFDDLGKTVDEHCGGIVTATEGLFESVLGESDKALKEMEEKRKKEEEERKKMYAEQNAMWEHYHGQQVLNEYNAELEEAKRLQRQIEGMRQAGASDTEVNKVKKQLRDSIYNLKDYYERLSTLMEQINYTDSGTYGNWIWARANLVGRNLVEGFNNGMLEASGMTRDKQSYMYTFADDVINNTEKRLGIASPSKVFEQIGIYAIEGYNKGIKETADASYKLMDTIFSNLEDIPEDYSIRPVLDFTDIQNGTDRIGKGIDKIRANSDIQISTETTTNAGRLNKLSDLVYDLIARSDNSAVQATLATQNAIIETLTEKLDSMGVYIDSNTLVGAVTPKIDKTLGKRVGNVGRSVLA